MRPGIVVQTSMGGNRRQGGPQMVKVGHQELVT